MKGITTHASNRKQSTEKLNGKRLEGTVAITADATSYLSLSCLKRVVKSPPRYITFNLNLSEKHAMSLSSLRQSSAAKHIYREMK